MKTSAKHNFTERQNNIVKVQRALFDKPELLSIDIKKTTGLSVSTISRVINELKTKGLLEICGKEKIDKGRFPQKLRFNFDWGYIVHIDIKPTAIYGCVANLHGEIILKLHNECCPNKLSLECILTELESFYNSLKGSRNVLAAGISLPGIANENKRVVNRIPDISALNDVDVFTLVEEKLGVPIIINNVPGVTAVGEKIANYPNCENLVYLNILQSIGIGAGIITNGKLIKGKDFIAGEVGDFYFDRKSFSTAPKKSIGRLEQYAGLSALYNRAEKLMKNGGAKNLAAIIQAEDVQSMTLSLIERSIAKGDKDVEELYLDVIRVWVILVIDIVLLLNPEEVVIGGAITSENTMTQSIINDMLSKEMFVDQSVSLGKAGENAVYIGGLHMLRDFVFDKILVKEAIK